MARNRRGNYCRKLKNSGKKEKNMKQEEPRLETRRITDIHKRRIR